MSDIQFDPNKVAADVFTSIVKESATTIKDYVTSPISKLIDAYKYSMVQYLDSTIEKCSKVKTFLNRDEPVRLLDVYVPTTFKSDSRVFSDDQLISTLSNDHKLIILGSAGSGKSMFMKYLLITLSRQPKRRVPVFIELRRLANSPSKSLIDFMYDSLVTPGAKTTRDQFVNGLTHSLFTVILDGFDEVDAGDRSRLEMEILALRDQFPKSPIIVSSREDERFSSWVNFRIYHVQPLAKQQVVDLIVRSKYDNDVKQQFIKSLKAGLYDKHKSFLSVPLLAVMMLITFREIAHIPDKMHIFYEQAFDALYFKHDASKEAAFRRKTHSELPIDEFKRCLSCFSIATYLKEKFSFTESQIRDDISKAIEMSKVHTSIDKFLADLIESVCMLQRDGVDIMFTHRSFQEYFAACFIDKCSSPIDKLADVLIRRHGDIVIELVFDMNKSRLEREWILPRLGSLVRVINSTNGLKQLIYALWGEVTIGCHPGTVSEFLFLTRGMFEPRRDPVAESLPDQARLFVRLYKIKEGEFRAIGWSVSEHDNEVILRMLSEEDKLKLNQTHRAAGSFIFMFAISHLPEDLVTELSISSLTREYKEILTDLLEIIANNVRTEEQVISALLP